MERNDLPILHEQTNNPEFMGKYEELKQKTKADLEKTYDNLKDGQWFFVQKKMEQKSAMSLIILQTEKQNWDILSFPKREKEVMPMKQFR